MKIENCRKIEIKTDTLQIPPLGSVNIGQKEWEKLYLTDKGVRKAVELKYINVTNQDNSKK